MGRGRHSNSRKIGTGPWAQNCFLSVPQAAENSLKMKWTDLKNKLHFCTLFLKQEAYTCFKQHAFCVDSMGDSNIFVFSNFHVFLSGANHEKKGSFGRPIFSNRAQNLPKGHPDPKKWTPKGPIPSFGGGPKDQSQSATLY